MTTINPTVTDEAVEAFKRAWHEADAAGLKGSRVERGLEAAAPLIAANALEEAAKDWEGLVQCEIPPVRGSVWLQRRADRIKARL